MDKKAGADRLWNAVKPERGMRCVSDKLYINTSKSSFGTTSKNTADSCISRRSVRLRSVWRCRNKWCGGGWPNFRHDVACTQQSRIWHGPLGSIWARDFSAATQYRSTNLHLAGWVTILKTSKEFSYIDPTTSPSAVYAFSQSVIYEQDGFFIMWQFNQSIFLISEPDLFTHFVKWILKPKHVQCDVFEAHELWATKTQIAQNLSDSVCRNATKFSLNDVFQIPYCVYWILEIERGSTRSHPVENSLWKRLRTCRKTDYRMNELCVDFYETPHTSNNSKKNRRVKVSWRW